MTTEELKQLSPLDLMMRWNHYCDTHGREGDCILLNEDRTYVEAFTNEKQAMKEIVNSQDPLFRRNEGYLVPLWSEEGKYAGMRYVPECEIGDHIDLSVIFNQPSIYVKMVWRKTLSLQKR